ncbi:MAG: hypothetical protein LZ170_06640, partial [Thaumarchaeota archaeon]|nr:hypothetical protein [Candidatus Terraquivivens yellowstonensis]
VSPLNPRAKSNLHGFGQCKYSQERYRSTLKQTQNGIGIKEIRLHPWVSMLLVVRVGGGSMP